MFYDYVRSMWYNIYSYTGMESMSLTANIQRKMWLKIYCCFYRRPMYENINISSHRRKLNLAAIFQEERGLKKIVHCSINLLTLVYDDYAIQLTRTACYTMKNITINNNNKIWSIEVLNRRNNGRSIHRLYCSYNKCMLKTWEHNRLI